MSNKPRNATAVEVSWLDCVGGFEDATPIGTGDLSHVPREREHVELLGVLYSVERVVWAFPEGERGSVRIYLRNLAYEEEVRNYTYIAGNPVRTDDEDARMRDLRKRLRVRGIEFDWEPCERIHYPYGGMEPDELADAYESRDLGFNAFLFHLFQSLKPGERTDDVLAVVGPFLRSEEFKSWADRVIAEDGRCRFDDRLAPQQLRPFALSVIKILRLAGP